MGVSAAAVGNKVLVDRELTSLRELIGKRAVAFVVPAVARAGAGLLRRLRFRADHRLIEQDVTGGGAESTWERLLAINALCDPTEYWVDDGERRAVSAKEALGHLGRSSCTFPLRMHLRGEQVRGQVLVLLDALGARDADSRQRGAA